MNWPLLQPSPWCLRPWLWKLDGFLELSWGLHSLFSVSSHPFLLLWSWPSLLPIPFSLQLWFLSSSSAVPPTPSAAKQSPASLLSQLDCLTSGLLGWMSLPGLFCCCFYVNNSAEKRPSKRSLLLGILLQHQGRQHKRVSFSPPSESLSSLLTQPEKQCLDHYGLVLPTVPGSYQACVLCQSWPHFRT